MIDYLRRWYSINFQNIPRQDKVIKKAFIPKLDALLYLDYKNIEPRLLAFYLSGLGYDGMTQLFKDQRDLYSETIKRILKLDRDPTEEERQKGKILVLSTIYGGGLPTTMLQLACDKSEASDYLKRFHFAWPEIGRDGWHTFAPRGTLMGELHYKLETVGFIKTLWGRELHPEYEYKRLNVLIQGCAADLMRWAIVQVYEHLRDQGLVSHLVSTVHDELILDCVFEELEYLTETVPDLMKYPLINDVVPIGVDIEFSTETWADKRAYEGSIF